MSEYSPKKIEKRWQERWERDKIFEAKDFLKKPKFFVLDMFPYPSGAGLHVGHPRGYIGSDVIAHFRRMKGYNVLHPMGWDAFGLPAENYAIETGIHPAVSTQENIKRFKQQMRAIGLSYDWSREINTTDPDYYKWTQWIFLKLFERGLAYQATLPINWCPSCKTGLANEEVVGGICERCGAIVTKKNIRQWVLKITDYAEKLLEGLDKLDWPEKIKEMQRNWIGKSEGADIIFQVKSQKPVPRAATPRARAGQIKVFTTRPDTIFGATFMVLAPEHELVEKITAPNKLKEVKKYQEETKKKLDIERQAEVKEKTGVFIGVYAINPATEEEIPIYIADYVLPSYGYGAIMGVPAHDQRDYDFAKKFDLPIIEVIQKPKGMAREGEAYEGEGLMINSGKFNGMSSEKGRKEITKWLQKKGCGKEAVNYKLRDWIFSRQRYWGEPIPLVFCTQCKKRVENAKAQMSRPPSLRSGAGGQANVKLKKEFSQGELINPGWVALSENELPLSLPKIEKYQPTGTGESPLAQAKDWVETNCPKCGGPAKRETNTMPQWAGSCWYFIRYLDSKNKKELAGKKLMKYWLPVDFYIGGAEHAVLHLLYSRFWIKVLYDAKVIHFDEPFLKLQTIGLILAPDGQKMSKSRGNVINPDEIIEKYGADTFRLYEMFMGPFEQPISWDPKGILGAKRFLEKIWKLFQESPASAARAGGKEGENLGLKRKLHQTIKKVTEDIEEQKFNTAIAAMMELVNTMSNVKCPARPRRARALAGRQMSNIEDFLKILAPFAPHMAEELWQRLGHKESILKERWPEYDKKLIKEEAFYLVVQINGKVRDTIGAPVGISEKQAKDLALKSEKIQKWLKDKKIKKTIFLKDKLINFVVDR